MVLRNQRGGVCVDAAYAGRFLPPLVVGGVGGSSDVGVTVLVGAGVGGRTGAIVGVPLIVTMRDFACVSSSGVDVSQVAEPFAGMMSVVSTPATYPDVCSTCGRLFLIVSMSVPRNPATRSLSAPTLHGANKGRGRHRQTVIPVT